jgi:acyl transferase domain-containing protein
MRTIQLTESKVSRSSISSMLFLRARSNGLEIALALTISSHVDVYSTIILFSGPVLFDQAVRQCLERYGVDTSVFLEMSAHPVLSSYLTENGSKYNLCTLHRQQSEIETTLKTLANLRIYGYSPVQTKISRIYSSDISSSRISHYFLYPFQRQYCVKEDPAHRLQRTVPIWHSLAGRPLAHPHTTFQTKLSLKSYRWIEDHRVQGPAVFPAAGYIEICMEVFNCKSLIDIHIEKALILPSDPNTYRTVRIVLDEISQSQVSMFSKGNEYDLGHWTKHMKATKGDLSNSASLPIWSENLKSRCTLATIEQKDVYGRFSSVGLDYGPHFQCIRTLYQGDNEVYAHINMAHLPKPLADSKQSRFYIHPALLDSTFQVLLGTQRYFYRAYVPTFIKRIEWRISTNELPNDLYVYARTTNIDHKQILVGDIIIVDGEQRLIGMIDGFEATALGQSNQSQPLHTLHYQNIATPIIKSIKTEFNPIDIPTHVKSQETLFDDACTAYISAFLMSNPFDADTVERWPIHRQRYWQWLHSTIKSKTISSDSIQLIDQEQCKALHYEAQAIHRVGKNLHLLLSDNFAVQNIFFGDSDPFMADLYSKSITFQPYTHILAQNLVNQFKMIQEQPGESSRVFSILELGAGTGALTSIILEKLYEETNIIQENRLIYVFTDVSGKFLSDAKKRFSSLYPCMQYQLCNLDVDLSTQKVDMYSFDIVCAFDVLHVAQDLKLCLSRVQQLLKPNGCLLCIELTRPWTWIEFFFGLFTGWWHFTDTSQRSTCFLTTDRWQKLLSESGFHQIQIENEGQPELAHSLLVARGSDWTVNEPTSTDITILDTTDATITNADEYMEQLLKLAQSLITVTEVTTVIVLTSLTNPPIGAAFTGFTRVWANECTHHIICSIEFDPSELPKKQMWLNRIRTIVGSTCEREFIICQQKIIVPRHITRTLENAVSITRKINNEKGMITDSYRFDECPIE